MLGYGLLGELGLFLFMFLRIAIGVWVGFFVGRLVGERKSARTLRT